MMLLIEVEVDRLRGVLDRQQVLALALALVDLLQRRRRGRVDGALLGRRALDELLADQRLRADLAARVGAEVLVAAVLDVEHHDRLEVLRDVERLDPADLDAGDLDVLAGDDEAGVVEDRADLVGAAVVARADGQHRGGGHGEQEADGGEALHVTGPGALGSGRSRRRRGCRRRSTAPSRPRPAGWRRPGSAWRCWSAGPSNFGRGPAGVSTPPVGLSVNGERVEDRLDAGEVAVGVVVGGRLAEVVEPARELRGVGADELEHRLALAQRLRSSGRRSGWRPAGARAACASRRAGRCRRRGASRACAGRGSSAARRARAGAARAGTGRGPSSRAWTRRPARRGRRASRAGSRTSCWRAAASSAAARAPAASATFSEPIARAVALVLPTRSARSSRRSATAVTAREELTMKSVSVPSSSVSWLTSRREVERNGLKYSADLAACGPLPWYCAAKPWMTPWRSLRVCRVERVEELVEVDDVGGRADGSVAPSSSSLAELGAGVSAM